MSFFSLLLQLLLGSICKLTTETHADFADLTNALAQVKGINEYIDTQKEIADNQKKLLRLYNSIVAKDCPIPEVRWTNVI